MRPDVAAVLSGPLPHTAEQVWAEHGTADEAAVLARNPFLSPVGASLLCRAYPAKVVGPALRRADDPEVVAAALSGRRNALTQVLWNPRCDPAALTSALVGNDPELRLLAAINPGTCAQARRDLLTPAAVLSLLVAGKGTSSDRYVRAALLVDANPWMVDTAYVRAGAARRAVAAHPDLTDEVADAVAASGPHGWRDFAAHPMRTCGAGRLGTMSTADLLASATAAGDAVALGRDDLTAADACRVLTRDVAVKGAPPPAPHIVAGIVDRFGAVAVAPSMHALAGTRAGAAVWCAPAVLSVPLMPLEKFPAGGDDASDPSEAVALLGEDRAAWEVFVALCATTSVPLGDTARAAVAVAA